MQSTSHDAIKGAPGVFMPTAEMQEELRKQGEQADAAKEARVNAQNEGKTEEPKKAEAKKD
ncbi:hypothetical protein H072_8195 [Dactylellina haptotyla CBS 200.50]|uniref:Uncharacterized protein n=1 Tax=Dactylellina haptotyla (strain CBS 200.50) TaxID=1284197 RepID=S8BS66_DACHA|nr:hypothetical protein H072_8195 [Dactylellina haptotyla CBS 200.50]